MTPFPCRAALLFCFLMSFVALSPAAPGAETGGAPALAKLTTNGRTNPLGVAAQNISFGWTATSAERGVTQQAYQLRVGTSAGLADLWDSERTESARQVDIVLPASVALAPATRYHWQVRIWDQANRASEWSEAAWFETGLLTASDWAGAEWLVRPTASPDIATWTDYTATVEFTLQNEAFGVFLRSSADARNAYLFQVNLTGATPVFKPHRRSNGAYSVLATVDLSPFGFTNAALKGSRHTLRFDVTGTTIVTRLDGIAIDTRSGIALPSGFIGFRTNAAEAGLVHRVEVVGQAGAILAAPDFSRGENGFGGGVVVDGALRVSGTTDAVFGNFPPSLPLLRGEFTARAGIASARLYASAQGLYEASVNGHKAGDQFLAPGWTDYNKRIQHQTYDITSFVQPGVNVVGAALADGWFRGKVGLNWTRVYGTEPAFVAKIRIAYTDGSVEWFATGPGWKAGDGPFVQGDNQDGETYNAYLEQPGWNAPGFDASRWRAVAIATNVSACLVPQPDEPVRALTVLTAKSRTEILPGTWIYDLGQNMVGVPRVVLGGTRGQTVTLRHAEELYRTGAKTGQIYTDNLRTAKATDRYIFAADGIVTYQPTFTQHGFRYIEITGTTIPPAAAEVQGVVLGSDLPGDGDLRTSHAMLNQLVSNIRWGQRGNFLSIPTDTPARDERLGWTGDISVFAPAAARYKDTRAFLSKWMTDVRDTQRSNGNIPAVVPQPRTEFDATGVGWSDAFVTVPYAVWRATGDERILRENWEAMKRFHAFVHASATGDGDLLEQGRSSWFSGDWLTLESVNRLEEHKVIATVYFAENTRMMAEMAAALGETARAAEWSALVPQIRAAFVAAYRSADGSIYTGTQTAYALALGTDMIADPAQRAQTAAKFLGKLAADNYHLKTGFLGTPWLLPALSKIGRDDLAMRLLLNEDYPSWGFPITMGATTMWERWNSIQPGGDFGPVDMNSFNHYAYGAVGDWMFAKLGGLQALEPGYKAVRIAPLLAFGGLAQARCTQETAFGPLAAEWSVSPGTARLAVEIPVNTSAIVHLPGCDGVGVSEGVVPVATAPGVRFLGTEDGAALYAVGSGAYVFTWTPGLEAPAGLKAVPGAGQVALSWSVALGATVYEVRRSTAPGGPYQTIAQNLGATAFTDTNVADGATYYYVVSSHNAAGETRVSAEVSATPALIQNAGFETPATVAYVYAPSGAGWSFSAQSGNNGSGLSADGSLFTSGSAGAPEGRQLAFLQGTGSIAQTLSGLSPGVTYHLLFAAAQRASGSTWNAGGQTWKVTLDGNTIATCAPGQAATGFVTYTATFMATASAHTLAFVGTNTRGGDNTVFLDEVRLVRAAPVAVPNAGFEAPATAAFAYNPAGAAWSFSAQSGNNGSGLARNASLFTSANPVAPEGVQVAFLQGVSSAAQSISGLVPGMRYHLLFSSAQRATYVNGGQTWNVTLDGATIASFKPGASAVAYTGYAASFTATAATHTLAFVGTNANGGDNTAFLDDIRLVPASPFAPAGATATAGNKQAMLQWTPVSGATAYLIVRRADGGAETLFRVGAGQTSFIDAPLLNGVAYLYRITPADESGAGLFSASVTATPVAPPVSEREKSAPRIALEADDAGHGQIVVTVAESVPGHFYTLQFCDDLVSGDWQAVSGQGPWEGTGGDLGFIASLDGARRFFRVLIES